MQNDAALLRRLTELESTVERRRDDLSAPARPQIPHCGTPLHPQARAASGKRAEYCARTPKSADRIGRRFGMC